MYLKRFFYHSNSLSKEKNIFFVVKNSHRFLHNFEIFKIGKTDGIFSLPEICFFLEKIFVSAYNELRIFPFTIITKFYYSFYIAIILITLS